MGVKPKYYMIVSETTGLVLDVKGGGTSPGTEVLMYEKHGNDNQLWYDSAVTRTVRSKQSNLCLDFNSDNRLIVNDYEPGNTNQQFYYNKQRRTIDNAADPNKVFDVVDGNTDSEAEVCAWDYHGGDNQRWIIDPCDTAHYFFIKSAMNGKVLDIEGGDPSPGAKVLMYDPHDPANADNQLWFEDRYGNIRSKLNDQLVLDSTGDCLHTSEFQMGNHGQYWCVDGNKVVNRYDPNTVLDIKGECSDDCAEVCAYGYKGSDNQHWIIEYVYL